MDDNLLDAICERLVSSLSTQGTYIVREDDPVNEMLFIIRGQLESSTTDGGRSGFFNSITLRPGDFCGEELLTWALLPNPTNYPSSTRSVRTLTEVEGFALQAEDLKFVANQFKYLHSKKLQHAFRYYSHQWRTWGACFIQAAWRKYKRRKLAKELALQENAYYGQDGDGEGYYYDSDSSGGSPSSEGIVRVAVNIWESERPFWRQGLLQIRERELVTEKRLQLVQLQVLKCLSCLNRMSLVFERYNMKCIWYKAKEAHISLPQEKRYNINFIC
ncbi:hypothetical protein OSB04_007722 [Centaurea solstitialis]|uniref:Cyclic nucleotide-binding domain-containing protein n=1 Tax=Centaurea solstitialis TaxID=347529 RepID=A0AA38WIU2_9ASTR|nr:hypothetical protein OSB04_007722 [Centaurea solstitialis]